MLRWYQKLSVKVTFLGVIIFAVISGLLYAHYLNAKQKLIESNKIHAIHITETIETALFSFLLETEQGGALIDGFVEKLNARFGKEIVRIVQSESIHNEYAVGLDISELKEELKEVPGNQIEQKALLDGERTFYENEEYFNYVVPIKAIKGCTKCHHISGDSDA